MAIRDVWQRYRWSLLVAILGAVLITNLWKERFLPGIRTGISVRRRLDSLTALERRLPELKTRWKLLSARSFSDGRSIGDSAEATRIQHLVVQSGLLKGEFRVEVQENNGRLPLRLSGSFLDVSRLLASLEREGATPLEWDFAVASRQTVACDVVLRVGGKRALR